MKALGNYILAGKYKATGIISLLSILSLLFPPFSYILSGVPLGLITLRKGAQYAINILFVAFLLTSIFGYFSRMGIGLGAAFTTIVWLPVWMCSMILRITESQGLSVLGAGGVGILFVLVLLLFTDEITILWESWVNKLIEQNFSGSELTRMQELMDQVLPVIPGIIATGVVISIITTLILARCWQSAIFNPGGFRQEFHRLLLPRWLIFITFFCLIISYVELGDLSELMRNFLRVLIVLHVVQGISSVHRIVFNRKFSRNWLVLMYSFLLFFPQILACIGIADVLKRSKKSISTDAE